MNDQPKITVDGKESLLDRLSQDTKAQLGALNMTDRKRAELQQEIAIVQTARNAYAQAPAVALPKN